MGGMNLSELEHPFRAHCVGNGTVTIGCVQTVAECATRAVVHMQSLQLHPLLV